MAALKTAGSDAPLPVPGTDPPSQIGWLVPVSQRRAQDPEVIQHICRWRSEHRTAFLTVFEPSLETTRSYLTNISLPDPGRILFVITGIDGSFVGCAGLRSVEADSAELDSVLRGEPPPQRGFMRHACAAVLDFAFNALAVSSIYLHVLHDNDQAIGLYRKLGLLEVGRSTLTRQPIEDGYRLVPAPQGTAGTLIKMEGRRARR